MTTSRTIGLIGALLLLIGGQDIGGGTSGYLFSQDRPPPMPGQGKYVMTVNATPDMVTAAARKADEQMKMTDINSSVDMNTGKVTARTTRQGGVRIEIAQSGHRDSIVTIYTHGDDADEVSRQIQDQINRNL